MEPCPECEMTFSLPQATTTNSGHLVLQLEPASMPRVVCRHCSVEFPNAELHNGHLLENTTTGCKNAIPPGRGVLRHGSWKKRAKDALAGIDQALEASRQAQIQSEGEKQVNHDVFDFHNEESDPEVVAEVKEQVKKRRKKAKVHPGMTHPVEKGEGITSGLSKFKDYVDWANGHHADLEPKYKAASELMLMMNLSGGSLGLFEKIMAWHVKWADCKKIVDPDDLHKTLKARYNMEKTDPYQVEVKLPCAGATINVVCHDATSMTVDLLTDPRLAQEDYTFPGNHPSGSPPEEAPTLGEIHTGRAYRETYKALVEPHPYTRCGRRKVLLPYIFYIDGCVTGQFNNLEIEILKFTLGIFNRSTRRKEWAWRNLGYIHQTVKGHHAAREIIAKSKHLDASNYKPAARPKADVVAKFDADIYRTRNSAHTPKLPEVKSQDLHAQLQAILESYKLMDQGGGLNWNMPWNGTVGYYRLVPFLIWFNVDGKEADKLCGQYVAKTEKVGCLCRYCCCPTMESHVAYRDDKLKSQKLIQMCVTLKKTDKLKTMSQQDLWNAFYEITFGQHTVPGTNSKGGIHQACPLDTLHWFLLGQLGYSRDSFFSQTGPDSNLSRNLDALAAAVGVLLDRQSDRSLPRVRFNRGVQAGKVMAYEMVGLALDMIAMLRSTRGRKLILETAHGKQKQHFQSEDFIQSWINFLEMQLQLHDWLRSTTLEVEAVERSKTKMKEYMNRAKHVRKRSTLEKTMGNNTMNHHGTKHLPQQILDFGVPDNWNTDSNEGHHRPDKKTSLRTQRHHDKFNEQMAEATQSRQAVELAAVEQNGHQKWKYYSGFDHSDRIKDIEWFETELTGVSVQCMMKGTDFSYVVTSKMKNVSKYKHDVATRNFFHGLLHQHADFLREIRVCECMVMHDVRAENGRQIYRASPLFEGSAWNDWAMFDLSRHNNEESEDEEANDSIRRRARKFVPCHIKAFLDFRKIPSPNALGKVPAIYALVEPAHKNPSIREQRRSEMFEPWLKQPSPDAFLNDKHHQMELVDVSCIQSPTTVIPDLGNANKRAYLRLVDRSIWKDLFNDWLLAPHVREFNFPEDEATGGNH